MSSVCGSQIDPYPHPHPQPQSEFSTVLIALPSLAAARDLILRLRMEDYRIGIAKTLSPSAAVQAALLKSAGVAELIDLSVCGIPNETVVFAETPQDLKAAQSQGFAVVGFLSGGYTAEHFTTAIAVYKNPSDALKHFANSPLVRERRACRNEGAIFPLW